MEGVGDARVAEVVGQVVVIPRPHVQIDGFEFNERERDAVDKADQVCAAVVVRHAQALNLQLAHSEEAVVGFPVRAYAIAEIDHLRPRVAGLT